MTTMHQLNVLRGTGFVGIVVSLMTGLVAARNGFTSLVAICLVAVLISTIVLGVADAAYSRKYNDWLIQRRAEARVKGKRFRRI